MYLWTSAEVGISYLFPQTGVVVWRWKGVKTAYHITKVASGIPLGDLTVVMDYSETCVKSS